MTLPVVGTSGEELYHDGSHRWMLTLVNFAPGRQPLGAIIVPTIRPADALEAGVIALARKLGIPMLLLCSGRARASEIAARTAGDPNVTAVDVTGLKRLMPDFETTAIHQETQPLAAGDLSLKRNLGLIIARTAGWQRILFLDDDIDVPHPEELEEVAAVSDRFDAVGLNNKGFQDNSVVCHALRYIGVKQDTFVGGGAMVVRPGRTRSFFPHIYNEDWLFLLRGQSLGSVAMHGTMMQRPFDPFDTTDRAAGQEFGDCIAEGLYWLLDRGSQIRHADTGYWRHYLQGRLALIKFIERRMVNLPAPPDVRARLIGSLRAARTAHTWITPGLCDTYMNAWDRDRTVWLRHLRKHPVSPFPLSAGEACRDLGFRVNCDVRPDPRRLSVSSRSETVGEWPLSMSVPPTTETSPALSPI